MQSVCDALWNFRLCSRLMCSILPLYEEFFSRCKKHGALLNQLLCTIDFILLSSYLFAIEEFGFVDFYYR